MNSFILSLLLFGSCVVVQSMTDKEIEQVKKLVDAELLKRELDVILAQPKTKSLRTTKLNSKTDTTTERPKTNRPTTRIPVVVTTKTATKHIDYELQHSIDNCIDMYDSKKCKILINVWKMHCDKSRMEDMCKKSCGYCPTHANPYRNCLNTRFGCCPDGLTAMKGPKGRNCPECKDSIPELCKGHKNDCNEVGMVGEWMRANCKLTCDVCSAIGYTKPEIPQKPECKDDPDQEVFCPAWKQEGLCRQIPVMMKTHCAKTCGIC